MTLCLDSLWSPSHMSACRVRGCRGQSERIRTVPVKPDPARGGREAGCDVPNLSQHFTTQFRPQPNTPDDHPIQAIHISVPLSRRSRRWRSVISTRTTTKTRAIPPSPRGIRTRTPDLGIEETLVPPPGSRFYRPQIPLAHRPDARGSHERV